MDNGAGQAGRESEGANGGKGAASAATEAAPPAHDLQLLRPVRKMWAKAWNTTYLSHPSSLALHAQEPCGFASEQAHSNIANKQLLAHPQGTLL